LTARIEEEAVGVATVERPGPVRLRGMAPVALLALAVVFVASLPFWLLTSQFTIGIAVRVLVFACLAVSWGLLAGYGGQVSFGHAAFFGLGAYTTALLFIDLRVTPWLGMWAGVLVALVASFVIGLPSFRLRGIFFSLCTFAFSLILQTCFTYFQRLTGGDVGVSLPLLGNRPEYFEFEALYAYYYFGLLLLIATIGGVYLFMRSRLGLYLLALRDSHEAAESLGVNTTYVKMAALLVSATACALAGSLYVGYTYFIDPSSAFGVGVSLQIALLGIAGGLNTVWGPALGAAVLIPVGEWLNTTLGGSHAGVQLIIYSCVLILIVLLLPRGMAGGIKRLYRAGRGMTRR
jgi:branched-chain amino acid transport system permease protein